LRQERPGKLATIGIDGVMSVRKTGLATMLASDLSGSVVSFDNFHPGTGPPYVGKLDIQSMRAAILAAQENGPTILEGICFLDVIERTATVVNTRIYVLPRTSTAVESGWLDDDIPLDEIERPLMALGKQAALLDLEIARYTRRRRPHTQAGFLFRWSDPADEPPPGNA
jgi:hypothetical protein